eukprot:scaffold27584_cov154-Skeletonema_menzelii.AAC.2
MSWWLLLLASETNDNLIQIEKEKFGWVSEKTFGWVSEDLQLPLSRLKITLAAGGRSIILQL